MPISDLLNTRKIKRSNAMYPPGFHNGSIVKLDRHSAHLHETHKSTHDPIMELNFGFVSPQSRSTSTKSLDIDEQYLKGYYATSSRDNNGYAPFAPHNPSSEPSKPARYYSHAHSYEDKFKLAHGELNHNLQAWGPEDMVEHHEYRKSLVPQSVGKLRKMEAFAKIEEKKQHSQRALDKLVRGKALLPSFRLTTDKGQEEYIAYHPQASQSMYDLRLASTLATQPSGHATASPLLVPTPRRKYSWEADQAPSSPYQDVRTAGGTDSGYFSFQSNPEMLSTPASRTSSRVPSPRSNRETSHKHNPDMTFDTFLVPHKSGKGEAYRGADNAKKTRAKASNDDFGLSVPGPAKEKTLRMLKKMRSTPALRQYFSRPRQQGGEEVPDVQNFG